MMTSRVRRWLATGAAGALLSFGVLVTAAPAAASDPLVVPVGSNDPQSNIVVVGSPGFVTTGTAYNPVTNTGNAPNGAVTINGQPYFVDGTGIAIPYYMGMPYYLWNGVTYIPYTGAPIYGYGYGYAVPYGCPYGCTAAGPIVGVQQNGVAIVRDVRTGFDDLYVFDPGTGKFVPSDVNGNTNLDVPTRP